MKYDFFICYATEDKEEIVLPIVNSLKCMNYKVWFDEEKIKLSKNTDDAINEGVCNSNYAIVFISPNFLNKDWTRMELGKLSLLCSQKKSLIIPLYHKISREDAAKHFPFLYDKKGITTDNGIEIISNEIAKITDEKKETYTNLQEKDLQELIFFFQQLHIERLLEISKSLQKILDVSSIDLCMSINKAEVVINSLLIEIYKDINKNSVLTPNEILEFIIKEKKINKNIIEHFKLIKQLSFQIFQSNCCENIVSHSDYEICKLSLQSIINWFYNTYYREIPKEKRIFSIIKPHRITKEDIEESFQIEKKLLPHDIISPVKVVIEWYNHNPETLMGIRDEITGQLVGFFNTIPITDELFAKIESGNYIDTYIPLSEIRQYDLPDFYKLYMCSVCIDPVYQNTNVFRLLYNAFVDFLLELATEKEVFVTDIIADAVTNSGEKLCKTVGMQHVTASTHDSQIYKATLIPPSIQLRNENGRKLVSFCKRKYDEFKEFF